MFAQLTSNKSPGDVSLSSPLLDSKTTRSRDSRAARARRAQHCNSERAALELFACRTISAPALAFDFRALRRPRETALQTAAANEASEANRQRNHMDDDDDNALFLDRPTNRRVISFFARSQIRPPMASSNTRRSPGLWFSHTRRAQQRRRRGYGARNVRARLCWAASRASSPPSRRGFARKSPQRLLDSVRGRPTTTMTTTTAAAAATLCAPPASSRAAPSRAAAIAARWSVRSAERRRRRDTNLIAFDAREIGRRRRCSERN